MDVTFLVIGGFILLIAVYTFKPSGLMRATSKAISSGDIAPLVKRIEGESDANRATCFNKVVKAMWNSYERPLAAAFIRAIGPLVAGAHITQYWLKQVIEIEPELAKETFDDEFLHSYYRPEVAAQCGKAG